LLDSTTLKYLLLIFDSITFLDDIQDSEWRRIQLQRMARENRLFSTFEELADDYDMLSEYQIVKVFDPKLLNARNSTQVALATLADLSDAKYTEIASKPYRYGLPARPLGAYQLSPEDRPTWQIFPGKIVGPLLEDERFLKEEKWASQVLVPV
jgi:hypothetical protein